MLVEITFLNELCHAHGALVGLDARVPHGVQLQLVPRSKTLRTLGAEEKFFTGVGDHVLPQVAGIRKSPGTLATQQRFFCLVRNHVSVQGALLDKLFGALWTGERSISCMRSNVYV